MTDDLETRWHAVNAEMTLCIACRGFVAARAGLAQLGEELLPMDEWNAVRTPLAEAEDRHRRAEHPDWWVCYEEMRAREEAARA